MLLAIACWAEGRSTGVPGMTGIACVVRNRVALQGWMGKTYAEVILKPYQFDVFLPGDPNYKKLLHPLSYDTSLSWEQAYLAAYRVHAAAQPDVTYDSQFYFTLPLKAPPKAWGATDCVVTINGVTFCRPSRAVPGMPT
jgi:hypothetical protein